MKMKALRQDPKTNPNEPKRTQNEPNFSPVSGPQSQNEPKRTQFVAPPGVAKPEQTRSEAEIPAGQLLKFLKPGTTQIRFRRTSGGLVV
jgi:hypothetical protein